MAGKVKFHELNEAEKKKYLGDFYSMVSILETREEVQNFFKDLLTLSEAVMIARRIQIAQMLLEGNSHEDIRKKLKVGFTTINNVERWLNNGFGGYKKAIRKFNKKQKKYAKDFSKDVAFSPEWVKKKYPLHYLLINLLDKNK